MRQRSGSSLLEIMIVLFLLLMALGSAIYYGGVYLKDSEAQHEMESLVALANNARELRSRNGYSEALLTEIIEMGLIPKTMEINPSEDRILNRWGGYVEVFSLDEGANFAINYTNMPVNVCKSLMVSMRQRTGVLLSTGRGSAHGEDVTQTTLINDISPEKIDEICTYSPLNKMIYFSTRSPY